MTATIPKIRERERQAILKSLRAGVVPRIGLQHIQVGRKAEVSALLEDLEAGQAKVARVCLDSSSADSDRARASS